jgi:5-methylcytosine-specific restriction enzyme subunit McrC
MMAYAHLYKAPRLTLLCPHHDGLGEMEGVQAQFRITGGEMVLETASIDVADGKDLVDRLKNKILLRDHGRAVGSPVKFFNRNQFVHATYAPIALFAC